MSTNPIPPTTPTTPAAPAAPAAPTTPAGAGPAADAGGIAASPELAAARDAWSAVFERSAPDGNVVALFGGANVRLNAVQALKAVYHSTKLYLKFKAIALTGGAVPLEWLGVAADLRGLATATLDALREKLTDVGYAACVVLSAHPDGLTEAEFEGALRRFVDELGWAEQPWYMGFNADRIAEARKALAAPDAMHALVSSLYRDDWLVRDGDRLRLRPRHFAWGFSID